MHELTLANSLVELADSHAAKYGAFRVSRIDIRLGELCGIARALYFCFQPAARGTRCEGAALHIAEVPLSVHCETCDGVKRPRSAFNLTCPDCGRRARKVLTGREMELVSIELDGPPPVTTAPRFDLQSQGQVQ